MEENHNCLYCPYATTDMKKLKRHEEQLHGCFRDKVTRKNSWREPSTWNGKGKEIGHHINQHFENRKG